MLFGDASFQGFSFGEQFREIASNRSNGFFPCYPEIKRVSIQRPDDSKMSEHLAAFPTISVDFWQLSPGADASFFALESLTQKGQQLRRRRRQQQLRNPKALKQNQNWQVPGASHIVYVQKFTAIKETSTLSPRLEF